MRRASLAVAGVAAVVTAFPAAELLAGEKSLGVVGFWLLVALPGLMLLAEAARWFDSFRLAPLLPFAFLLLALDVTDSAREGVVIGGWVAAVTAAVAACALSVVAYRRVTPTAPS